MNNQSRIINVLFKYFLLIICLFISAINFNLFMKPVNFVTGGTPGLAIVFESFFDISANYFIYFIYIITFILSYITLGKKSIFGILIATICYPIFVTLTSNVIQYIIIDYNDLFLICLFSGIINGICNGLIYKFGFASSGLAVLGPIFHKYFHLSIASVNFFVNSIIVLIGGCFFGFEMILYAIIFLYLSSFVSNRLIVGISNNKVLLIRSKKINDINEFLHESFNLDPICFDVLGGYSKDIGIMSVVIVPTNRYNIVINGIKRIDNCVFFNVLDGYELKNI